MSRNNPSQATQFKQGKSGNPNGRPVGSKNRSTVASKLLGLQLTTLNELTGLEEKLSLEERITISLIKKALDGNIQAYLALMDSVYGKIKIANENETNNSINIPIISWVE